MANKNSRYLELMKAFGKAVRHYRNKLGYSQEALADRAQLDRSYMSQIERGIKNATLNSIWRISQALEVDPSALLKMTEELHAAGAVSADPRRPAAPAPAVRATSAGDGSRTILVVDDDPDICATIDAMLQTAGFATKQAHCGFDAFWVVASESIDAVVTDVRMANGNGLELLEALQKHYPRVPVVFITGYDDVSPEDARRRGAVGLIPKPFDTQRLVSLLNAPVTRPL
jgi:CheY-like chemotaxis protein/DNA-binding XRE family transcriptional regulator